MKKKFNFQGSLKAFFMCTFNNNNDSFNTQSMVLNKNITVSNLKNNPLACYWYDRTQSPKQEDFNCGAIQFENESSQRLLQCVVE